MHVNSIKVKTYLITDIPHIEASSVIAAFLDRALCKNPKWALLHEKNQFKPYSFSSLSPIEPTGIYPKDTLRTFTLRTLHPELSEYLTKELPHTETESMKGLVCEVWMVPQKPIAKLYSLTPLIVKCEEGGYWKGNLSFNQFQNQIRVNLIKKYNYFLETKLNEDFQLWNHFQLTNRKPIAMPYKGIKLLGDKLEIEVAENQTAQNLAYMALATGMGELCARGAGYVNFHTMKGV